MPENKQNEKINKDSLSETQLEILKEFGKRVRKQTEILDQSINKLGINRTIKAFHNLDKFAIPKETYKNLQKAVERQRELADKLSNIGKLDKQGFTKVTLPPRKVTGKEFREFADDFNRQREKITEVVRKFREETKENSQRSLKLSKIAIWVAIISALAALGSLVLSLIE